MLALQNMDFIAGVASGLILVGALGASTWFRGLALAAAASGLLVLYIQDGVSAIVKLAGTMRSEFLLHRSFGIGIAAGALFAVVVICAWHAPRSRVG